MATQKTPLSQAASPEPGRSQKTAKRSKVARNRVVVGGVVVVAVVAVGIFLSTRGGDVLGDVLNVGPPDRPVPEFAFELGTVSHEATVPGDNQGQQAAAEAAAEDVKAELDELYVLAFLDPDTWGDAGEIEDFFTGEAADQLEGDVAALTLGVDAGDTYEYVEPTLGMLKVRALTGEEGARMVQATTKFRALAEHVDGSYTTVLSTATFTFVRDGDAWRIQAYRVDRDEKPADAPSPTPSTTSSGDA